MNEAAPHSIPPNDGHAVTAEAQADGSVFDGGPLPVVGDREGLAFEWVKTMQIEGEARHVFIDENDEAVTLVATGRCPNGTQAPIPCR